MLFIVLEIVAVYYYADSTPYTRYRMLSVSSAMTGWWNAVFTSVGEYFSLREQNARLADRIAELENRIDAYALMVPESSPSVDESLQAYEYMSARVVSNSINRPKNHMTVGKGFVDGVREGMSVVTTEGFAVGSIVRCSEHYAVAMTMLNTDMRVGARLVSDGTLGTVSWNGVDPTLVEMSGVSKYASISHGEAVVTTGFSYLFPPDVMIGTVEEFSLDQTHTSYTVKVRLSADMSRLYNVVLVHNTSSNEAVELERGTYTN